MEESEDKQIGYSFQKVKTLKLKSANKTPDYDSIVVCQDKIIVIDIDEVKIHRLHDGKLLCTLDTYSTPHAMCLIDAMTIGVLHYGGLIEMTSIKAEDMSPVYTRMKSFCLDGVFDSYHSLVSVNGNIVVTGRKNDMMYWWIGSPNDGDVKRINKICKGSVWSYVTTMDNTLYISCCAGFKFPDNAGVYGFDLVNPSQCKYKYKHQRLQWPTSIVINEDGNIFVGNNGFHDYCIHQLTSTCQLVAIFNQGILRNLQAMFCYHGRLYVTRLLSRDITVFQPVYQVASPTVAKAVVLQAVGALGTKAVQNITESYQPKKGWGYTKGKRPKTTRKPTFTVRREPPKNNMNGVLVGESMTQEPITPMSNFDYMDVAKALSTKSFRGVFMKDQLRKKHV